MTGPNFVLATVVDAMHAMQIAEHGGAGGIRDQGLLDSALGRPVNLEAYGSGDVHEIAAAYAFGLARNHPFIDGNKRTAFLAAYVFLRANGQLLIASKDDAKRTMVGLAAGEIGEATFAAWLKKNCVAL
jgi:death-on-curing protein